MLIMENGSQVIQRETLTRNETLETESRLLNMEEI